jgi:hypothetical protein
MDVKMCGGRQLRYMKPVKQWKVAWVNSLCPHKLVIPIAGSFIPGRLGLMTNSTLTCGASVGLQPYRRTQGILIRCGALLCSFDCGNVATIC